MKQQILYALPLLGAVAARPTPNIKREVPGDHAHENVLQIIDQLLGQNNPDNIQASVFGLLGAAAGIEGAGDIADADCLQQATADQAFTNAKEAGDVDGMTFALIYRALERNTGEVGLASVPCESIQAVNPEIAALQQHQDPAGDGAQELNKQIAAELAVQIASIGGDPTLANEASTFAPGEIGDPTAAGNTCSDETDLDGCINTLGLRVDDLSDDEILAAVDAGSNADGAAAGAADDEEAENDNQKTANKNDKADNANDDKAANEDKAVDVDDAKANKDEKAANKEEAAKADDAAANKDKAAEAGDDQAANKNDKAAANKNNNAAADKTDNAAANADEAANANDDQANEDNEAANDNQQGANNNDNNQAAAGAAGADAFGRCDPTIVFGLPSDGRQEDAFEPADLATFNHGSALNINVISDFICSQLANQCDVAASAQADCDAAAAAADGLKGQAAADAFNGALGL